MVTLRRVERYTILMDTQSIQLDPEKFRGISIPYEGSTDKEFIEYIDANLDTFNDDEELWDELDEETQSQFCHFFEPEWKEFYNSAWDAGDTYIESGTVEDDRFCPEETTDKSI